MEWNSSSTQSRRRALQWPCSEPDAPFIPKTLLLLPFFCSFLFFWLLFVVDRRPLQQS
jgi:hypothetical protein